MSLSQRLRGLSAHKSPETRTGWTGESPAELRTFVEPPRRVRDRRLLALELGISRSNLLLPRQGRTKVKHLISSWGVGVTYRDGPTARNVFARSLHLLGVYRVFCVPFALHPQHSAAVPRIARARLKILATA